jgi:hypothetical protein
MAEPTFQDIFGAQASQTYQTITLNKNDFELTSAQENRAEQVFAAIVKRASSTLTQANFDTNPNQSITVVPGFESLVYRTNGTAQQTLLQTPLTINFAKAQASGGVTPDDY